MNLYSRALKYIDIEDVKKKNCNKLIEDTLFNERIKQAREVLKNWNSPTYSDWRSNHLKEGMTTGNVFYTTFPSTGETNLDNIDGSNADSYTDAGGNDAFEGTSIRSNGTGEGSDGGFDLGQSYLGFDGDASTRWAILNPIDSTKFDTLVLRAIRGDDSNGGEDPDAAGEELRLYYLTPDGNTFRSISINPDGQQVLPANSDIIIGLSDGSSQSLRDWSISLPSYARGEGFTYMLYQLTNSGAGFDHYGITNIKYQRRAPLSLLVSLDSPEATSFISDGSGGMTAEEKKKRLEDMLAASDEYLETMFPTNQEAMERARENLQRNIDISLDPNTFVFPEYGSPTYNQMYDTTLDATSSQREIDAYLEQQGRTIDTLDKDFVSRLGSEAVLNLINNTNPEYQEKVLNSFGIDMSLLTDFTDESYQKLTDFMGLRAGGTPSTGWDGKFYDYKDPALEASRIVPLDVYLKAKERTDFYGLERPDVAEPGKRYVMEKKYSFSNDNEATPLYTGPQNKELEDKAREAWNDIGKVGDSYGLGYTWDLSHFEKGMGTGNSRLAPGTNFAREQVIDSMTAVLEHMYKNADELAYHYLDWAVPSDDLDLTEPYDPLYLLTRTDKGKRALDIALNSTARQLDYPKPSSGGGGAAPVNIDWWYRDVKENDYTIEKFQKAYEKIKTLSTDFKTYEQDEWYIKDPNTTVTTLTEHPYSDQMRQTQQQPPDQGGPNKPYMNIKVGDEQVIVRGNETVLDTMRGIDNRQKNSIEREMDRIQKMPPDVRTELTRLLNYTGTSDPPPSSPKKQQSIEEYLASLSPEEIEEMEKQMKLQGQTRASGIDAVGLGLAILGGIALGTVGAGTAIGTTLGSALSRIKNLIPKRPPTIRPTQSRYPTPATSRPMSAKGKDFGARMRQQVSQEYGTTTSQQGGKVIRTKPTPQRGYNPGGNTSLLKNSYEPKGNLISEKSKDHNEIIAKQGKLKSPSEFFKRADVKPVYPDTPPPEMVQGRHPDLVDGEKVSDRFNRLDPISAKATPLTGNKNIDAKILKARKQAK
jgi:hypothetical protein